LNNLTEILQKEFQYSGIIKENILMSDYTSFKTGGPCRIGVFPKTVEDMAKVIQILGDSKYCVLGNGSNVLFPQNGYDGSVVFTTAMKNVEVRDDVITALCGAGITGIAGTAYKNSLSGLEFAYGIPGTLGGAVYMNAGAYDGEMAQVVETSTYVAKDGTVHTIAKEEHDFSYRHSAYVDSDRIIVECSMRLKQGDAREIKAKMDENMFKRRDKQPLEYPSAGSIFKRPPNNFAGKLISDCGLKGYAIGGAQVSEKHAGFIINTGNATTDDILKLIEYVKNEVYKNFSVELECEVRYIC